MSSDLQSDAVAVRDFIANTLNYSEGDFIRDAIERVVNGISDAARWHPIATAPKDGTQILVGWKGVNDRQVVRWIDGLEAWCVNNGGWGEDRYRDDDGAPTHWMPLPEEPK
jgi:hypothetical protein